MDASQNTIQHKLISIVIDELNNHKKLVFNIGCQEKSLFKVFSHRLSLDECVDDLTDVNKSLDAIKETQKYNDWCNLVANHNPLIGQVF